MSNLLKAIERLKSRPTDYSWSEAIVLLRLLGFVEQSGRGSRVRFVHSVTNMRIHLHRPHPSNQMKAYAVRQLCGQLEEADLI